MYEHHTGISAARRRRRHRIAGGLGIGLVLLIAVFLGFNRFVVNPQPVPRPNAQPEFAITAKPSGTIRTFSGDEFKNLYNSFAYPHTIQIAEPPLMTRSLEADTVIRELAEGRGYRLRSLARSTEGLADDEPIQLLAQDYWLALKQEAAAEGIILTITWAYRSVEDQRVLFMDALRAKGADETSIIARAADTSVNQVLEMVAPPGYSRHHTGYTIDLTCGLGGLTVFQETSCYEWLSSDNYARAKKHGWVPSYPKGASLQGPEPEAWEYIWVGVDALY